MLKADQIGAEYVVTHLGSGKDISRKKALTNVVSYLKIVEDMIPKDVKLLLENTSGSGNIVGYSLEELLFFVKDFEDEKIGIALDTCHLYAAGYEITGNKKLSKFLKDFDRLIGLERLLLLHLNDCQSPLGSRRDRHAGIGQGNIGLEGFKIVVNHPLLKNLPGIMETPRSSDLDDLNNMKLILSLIESG